MSKINDLAQKAVSPDLGERVDAQNRIKELRLNGSVGEKRSLRLALGSHLFSPEKAIYAGEALVELGDPAAIKQINDARNTMDTRGKGADVWIGLGESLQKLHDMSQSKSPADAIAKLDAQKKPIKVR